MKRLAEMAQARITDFHRRFSDVKLARAQKFRGAFHAQLSDVLRDRAMPVAVENVRLK